MWWLYYKSHISRVSDFENIIIYTNLFEYLRMCECITNVCNIKDDDMVWYWNSYCHINIFFEGFVFCFITYFTNKIMEICIFNSNIGAKNYVSSSSTMNTHLQNWIKLRITMKINKNSGKMYFRHLLWNDNENAFLLLVHLVTNKQLQYFYNK